MVLSDNRREHHVTKHVSGATNVSGPLLHFVIERYGEAFIPWGRVSSAKGYAQAQDPVWGEYQDERGRLFRSRSDMEDALDFIGWYNHKTWRELGISRSDAYWLYLAYHEGRGGYSRGSWKKKPAVRRTAQRVSETARRYKSQLARCESRFRCDSWYQLWPFCS